MLKREDWLTTVKRIHQLLAQVNKKQFKAQLKKCQEKDAAAAEKRLKAKENEEEKEGMTFEEEEMTDQYEVERSVFPSLSNFIERMDEQLWKSFQKLNHQDIAYILRIHDENALLFLIDAVNEFMVQFD